MNTETLCRLTEWLEKRGARFASLCLRTYDDGERGLHARVPIQKGEIVLAVPLQLVLTSDVAWISAIGQQIEASGLKLRSSHSYLAAYLLQERSAADSFWAPYIATMPASFPQMPLFFSSEELALLEGSFILAKIDARRSALAEEYQNLCRCVPGFDRFALDEFVWAHLAARTRCFGMEIYGRETHALVPMADMLNHRYPRETAWGYDDGAHSFVLTALKDFAPGDPVHTSYGRKCNSYIFLNYGFCLEENEDNRARIQFERENRAFHVPARLDHEDTQEMLSFLRLAFGDESRLALAAACTEALRRFPTSLEEDEALLQDQGLARNARNAILMRRGEKRALLYFLELALARTFIG